MWMETFRKEKYFVIAVADICFYEYQTMCQVLTPLSVFLCLLEGHLFSVDHSFAVTMLLEIKCTSRKPDYLPKLQYI